MSIMYVILNYCNFDATRKEFVVTHMNLLFEVERRFRSSWWDGDEAL